MPKINRTRFAILGLLAHSAKTGYAIRNEFAERTAHFWSESLGQVYPTLKRLFEEGLVVRKVEKQDGRPERIVYSITEDGRAELDHWIAEPSTPQPVRNEQLLKIFFASPRQAPNLLEDVRRHRERYRKQAAQFDSYKALIEEITPTPHRADLWRLNLSLGHRIVKARIDWCDEAIEVLNAIIKESST